MPLRSEKAKLNLLFYTGLCIYSNLRRLGPAEKRPGSFFFRRARKEVAPTKFPAESFNSIMLRANNDPFKLSSHTGLSLSLSWNPRVDRGDSSRSSLFRSLVAGLAVSKTIPSTVIPDSGNSLLFQIRG